MKTMYKYLALLIIGVIPSIAFGIDNAVFTKDDEKIINQYFKESFGDKADDASKVFASLHNQKTGIDSQGMKAVCISGLTKEQTVKFDCEKMWANIIDKTHPEKAKGEKVTTDAEFAKLCKEYGHRAGIVSAGDMPEMLRCLSSEVIRVSKLEEVETALKPFKDYWTAQGFECEKQVSKGGVDVVAYFYDCGIYGDFLARSGRVVLSENIVTDYATEDENTEPEPVDENAKIENLCKDYGYGAKLEYYGEGYYSCDANDSYDTKVETLEELKEKLDSLKAYWDAQGWECVFKHHLLSGGYEHDGFASHQLSWECQPKVEDEYNYVYAVHTPKVAIDSPCGFMGEGAKFKDYNLSCSCGDTYEEVNGKCQKASCKKNEFFNDDNKECKECPGSQRSEAGDNRCRFFNCPNSYQEAGNHMCVWKSADVELIDDYGPAGQKLELKSVQDGIYRIKRDRDNFESCDCRAEEGTPHMLYGSTDYIICSCTDDAQTVKEFKFSFTDLSDWNGK